MQHPPLVKQLAGIIINGDIFEATHDPKDSPKKRVRHFKGKVNTGISVDIEF